MSRWMLLSALTLGACATDVESAALPADQLAPAGALTFTHTPLVVGEQVTLSVSGAQPNQQMFLFRSNAVQVGGFCPGLIAPDCMDLAPPLINTFSLTSDANGDASITFRFPPVPPAASSIAMQVGYITNPGADTSNAVDAPIYQADSDTDGDYVSAAMEIANGTDPGLADSDGGGADDGFEIALGFDPTDPSDDAAVGNITFNNAISGLFVNRCSGCHINGSSSGGLNLDNYNPLLQPSGDVPSLANITPGSLEDSYLWHKVQGTQNSVNGSGVRMPRGRAALPDDEILMLEIWIQEGAPRN
jgi:hypothetical protein